MNPVATKIKTHMEKQGLRITKSRMQIVEAVSVNRALFTIEELSFNLVDVGRATVFRNIKLLLHTGVICRLITLEGQISYQLNDNWVSHHHHMICVECNEVQDFQAPILEREIKRIFKDTTEIIDHEVSIYFKCQSCRNSK